MSNILRKEFIIVVMFMVAIFLPLTDMCLKLDRFKYLNENRQRATLPQLTAKLGVIQKFPQAYTKYFNDNFGFRNSLVRANFIIRHNLLGASPSKQVVVGNDGWLFYNGEGAIEDYRGITQFDEKTLDKWAKTLEMKRVWLERQGIRYLFVVAPNKSSIYGEYLPKAYNRVRAKTGLDELIDYLNKHTKVVVVDCRAALMAVKSQERVYLKTDTHWNQYGAFLAYREVMKPIGKWFPTLQIKTIDNFKVEKKVGGGGDLASMIGGTEFIKEEYLILKPKSGSLMKIDAINNIAKSPVTESRLDTSLPRALVFRDSFFSWVAPYFAEHFQVSKYYWSYWNKVTPIEDMIQTLQPDIVVEEVVERLVKTSMSDFITNSPSFYKAERK